MRPSPDRVRAPTGRAWRCRGTGRGCAGRGPRAPAPREGRSSTRMGTLRRRARTRTAVRSSAAAATRSNCSGLTVGSGSSAAASRRSTASHSLTMPLAVALLARRRRRAGDGRRLRRADRAAAGEQLAQQARRPRRAVAVLEVDLGRADPRHGIVRVGLAPVAVGVERRRVVVLGGGQRGLRLEHGGVVGGGGAGAGERPRRRSPDRPRRERSQASSSSRWMAGSRCARTFHSAHYTARGLQARRGRSRFDRRLPPGVGDNGRSTVTTVV